MATSEQSEKLSPPYVSHRTFTSFLAGLKADGVPPVLDNSVMKTMSGAVQSQLKVALRYLGLVNAEMRPTTQLNNLVHAEGEIRKQIFREILEASYPFLLGDSVNDFSLANGTADQFYKKFRDQDIKGETVRKAEAFFLNVAEQAGLTVSKRIKVGRTSGDKRNTRPTRTDTGQKTTGQNPPATAGQTSTATKPDQQGGQVPPMKDQQTISSRPIDVVLKGIQTMTTKLPEFDPTWEPGVQASWFNAWERMSEQLMGLSAQIVDVTRLQIEAELGIENDEAESID